MIYYIRNKIEYSNFRNKIKANNVIKLLLNVMESYLYN